MWGVLHRAGEPWTLDEDEKLAAWWEVGFDLIGPHDLGRTAEETAQRWEFLKASGARVAK
jgi:hypothetical protein